MLVCSFSCLHFPLCDNLSLRHHSAPETPVYDLLVVTFHLWNPRIPTYLLPVASNQENMEISSGILYFFGRGMLTRT